MKKILLHTFSIFALLGAISLSSCNETLKYDTQNYNPPTITSFSPTSAHVGETVTLRGEDLHKVTNISIGGIEMTMSERVSSNELSFILKKPADGSTEEVLYVSGPIKAINPFGDGISSQIFEFVFTPPAVVEIEPQDRIVDMYKNFTIRGTDLSAVKKVIFTCPAPFESKHETTLQLDENNKSGSIKVPYVKGGTAKMTFTYYDGTGEAETSPDDAPEFTINRNTPVVDLATVPTTQVTVGASIVLEGTNMGNVGYVEVDGVKVVGVRIGDTKYRFSIPTANFVEGVNTPVKLEVFFYDGEESEVLTETLIAYVSSTISIWQDITTMGQARVEPLTTFFSPETGIVYKNSQWRTEIDPMSVEKSGDVCSASNVSKLTASEYNSVKPYFFFSGANAGTLMINSPAGSTGQLRNIYISTSSGDANRITQAAGNWYGTPIITYRNLPAGSVVPAEQELLRKFRAGEISEINETEFPIDEILKTVAGIDVSSATAPLYSTDWAPTYILGTEVELDVDAVVLFFYHEVFGTTVSPVANIKRVGILHIKTVDFKIVVNAPSASMITYDVYWQKNDYVH